jgi:hypothetical protein
VFPTFPGNGNRARFFNIVLLTSQNDGKCPICVLVESTYIANLRTEICFMLPSESSILIVWKLAELPLGIEVQNDFYLFIQKFSVFTHV